VRHLKLLYLFIFLWIATTQFLLWGKELKSISLEEVLSIGSLDDEVLYMWAGVTTDLKGNIYVTDLMDYSIKKFNDKGFLIKKTGRKGKGPGEFLGPKLIKHFSGLIYVIDQYIPGIQVFDEDLNYKGHITVNIPIFDLKIISENRIVISIPPAGQPECIIGIDSEGNPINDIKYLNKEQDYWKNFRKFEIDKQGNLYVVFTFEDKIEKFNKHNKKLWTKSLLGKKKAKREKSKFGPSELPTEVVYKDIAFDILGNLFILGGHISKHRSRDVYVLDQSGKHLTTFTLPESSHCIHIDNLNFFYSRAGMGTTLKKYSLKYIYK